MFKVFGKLLLGTVNNKMIFVLGLLGCTQKPFVFKNKPNQCRKIHSQFKTERDGLVKEREEIYAWSEHLDGSRVDFQAPGLLEDKLNNNYRIYNAQGFLIEEYSEDSVQQQQNTEYDCLEDWCWRRKTTESIGSGTMKTFVEKEYQWDGKTEEYETIKESFGEYQTGSISGYSTYNEYGYPVEEYHKLEQGYRKVNSEYICDDWCKLQSQKQKYFMRGRIPSGFTIRNLRDLERAIKLFFTNKGYTSEDTAEYDWDENRQEWKAAGSNGYRIYNEYGAVTEYFTEGIDFKSWVNHTYDCEEE